MTLKSRVYAAGKILLFLCLLPFLLGAHAIPQSSIALSAVDQVDGPPHIVYLPIVRHLTFPLMVGIYPTDVITQRVIDNEIKPLDSWVTGVAGGQSTAIVGTFIGMEVTDANAKALVETPLTIAWNNGYATFVNFPSTSSAFDVAAGKKDPEITAWAKSFKNFAQNGQRFAYIAPLQEMNGDWIPYGGDPGNFKLAFKRIRDIFSQVGVPVQSVKWVFNPNGWNDPREPRFEEYYPGDGLVDVVAISAYNWGYCRGAQWEEPDVVFNNPTLGDYGYYLDRLVKMAPSKAIFIAETASSSYKTKDQKNYAEKDRWLKDAYAYLAGKENLKAVLYLNFDKECDWRIYDKNGVQFQGYRTGINANGYRYIAPSQLLGISHSLR